MKAKHSNDVGYPVDRVLYGTFGIHIGVCPTRPTLFFAPAVAVPVPPARDLVKRIHDERAVVLHLGSAVGVRRQFVVQNSRAHERSDLRDLLSIG